MVKIKEIERTPNPNAMRFIIDTVLTQGVSRSYETAQEAQDDALGKALFEIDHVINVYYVDRYITVTQDGEENWTTLLRKLAQVIRNASVDSVQEVAQIDEDTKDVPGSDDERFGKINAILDEQVRPYLMADGGGLHVVGLVGDTLQIHYQGACGTCPTATTGTIYAIESIVKRIDSNIEVELV